MAAQAWETVYLFVSSTFNDMHGERDYLVKEVFHELRDWCEERKLRLVDIDLRWGVSEADATHNQRVVEVCLQNIDRCRPFFLCFLGQRYGWIPGLADVSAETLAKYPGLQAAIVDQRSVTELEVLHAAVAPFVGGEAKLAADQSFFYLREPGYLAGLPAEPAQLKRIYTDEVDEDAKSQAFLVDRQNKLRAAVSTQQKRPFRSYSARWSSDRRTPELTMPLDCPATLQENQERWRRDWRRSGEVSIPEGELSVPAAQAEEARAYSQRLCAGRLGDFWSDGRSLTEVIVDDLKVAILERYPERKELAEQDDLSREIDRHEDFVRTAADVFIERPGDFADLDAYAAGDSRKLLALVAKAGLGKSTLLANWVARWRSREGKPADETVHARFVGVGERSGTVDSLLGSILEELRRTGKLTSEIPDNPNVLRSKLAELLGECGKKGRTILVIDALNQLQSGLTDLEWLARTLPENVKLVVSFKLGDAAGDALAAQLRADERVTLSEVRPFAGLEERRQLVRQFLRQFLKELDEQHLEALIQADGADNPLFLKVVLTELRVFGAFGQLGEVIRREFGTTPQSAFEAVLRRLESDPSYAAVPSPQAVPLLFGLLAHSRGGLPEDLLARMSLAELGLGEARLADMEATIQLFLRQVRPFLARREGRVDFFYESFQLAARDGYTSEGAGQRSVAAWHGELARACDAWRTLTGASRRYALGNLVHHHVAAGHADQAAEALTEFGYHFERLKVLGREDVVNVGEDFVLVCGAARLEPELRTQLEVWQAFHAENAHLVGREGLQLGPETYLFQVAVAHAQTSPVTRSAEGWVEAAGSEVLWLLSLWRPRALERRQCLRTFEGHTCAVDAVAILPDGKRALSGSWKELRLWDIETGRCLRILRGHTDGVSAITVLPDGTRALSGGGTFDKTLMLWDLETGQCLRSFQGHTGKVSAIAVLSDGKRAISGSQDKTLRLWDLKSGEWLGTLQGGMSRVNAVALLPDGNRVLSANDDYVLRLWDIDAGRCLLTFTGHTSCVEAVTLMPDGRRALSGSADNTLKLWDLETGQCCRTLKGHTGFVSAVVVLANGKCALSASHDHTLRLWNLETGRCIRTLEGHTQPVYDVALLPDDKRALSGSHDGILKLWDIETGQRRREPEGHASSVYAVAMLPDGKRALSGSNDKTLRLWDLGTSRCLRVLNGHTEGVFAIAVLADGTRVLSGSIDHTLKLWDLGTGQCLRTFHGHSQMVCAVAISADGRHALSCGGDATLKLWNLGSGECLCDYEGHTALVRAVLILPGGRRALSASHDCTLRLWDLDTGHCLRVLRGHRGPVQAVALFADGARAISGGLDKTLKLWDLDTGQCLRTVLGHPGEVNTLALLPDGKRLFSGSSEAILTLWDVATGEGLATWYAGAPLTSCVVGPDSVFAGTEGGELLFLKLMPAGRIIPETIAATWHRSRPLLAVMRANGTILIQAWHPDSQYLEELCRTSIPSITSVQCSSDGACLLVTDRDGATRILDATTLQPASAPTSPWSAPRDVSPDGRWRAVIEAGQLRIFPASEA